MIYDLLKFFIVVLFFQVANLYVPLYLYHRQYGVGKKKYKGGGGCNGWSFVMDGLLAGLMNIVVTNYLIQIQYIPSVREMFVALGFGIIAIIISHITMSIQNWDIWIMPKPWKWNKAGYWHMISMTLQVGYFSLVPIALISNRGLINRDYTLFMVLLFAVLFLLFLYSFIKKDKGLVIGKFHINKEAW